MIQPDELKSDQFVLSSGGQGTDVWEMITSCISGDLQNVQKLLDKEASLSNCQWAYFTPIHFAVREGHIDIVKLLLKFGADATAKTISWQDSPLTKARDRGYQEIAELLEQHLKSTMQTSSIGSKIGQLIQERKVEQVQELIQQNPDSVHASDERGNKPLHWAVLTRQVL